MMSVPPCSAFRASMALTEFSNAFSKRLTNGPSTKRETVLEGLAFVYDDYVDVGQTIGRRVKV